MGGQVFWVIAGGGHFLSRSLTGLSRSCSFGQRERPWLEVFVCTRWHFQLLKSSNLRQREAGRNPENLRCFSCPRGPRSAPPSARPAVSRHMSQGTPGRSSLAVHLRAEAAVRSLEQLPSLLLSAGCPCQAVGLRWLSLSRPPRS